MSEYDYLKIPIIEFIKKSVRPTSLDVVTHFILVEPTLIALKELVNEGRIIRVDGVAEGWNLNHYYKIKRGE